MSDTEMRREADRDIGMCDWCGSEEDPRTRVIWLTTVNGEPTRVGVWLCAECRSSTELDHHDVAEDDPAVAAGLAAAARLVGTFRTEPAGMAYIIGAVDAARAQANWRPWWLADADDLPDAYYDGVRDGIAAHATISGGELLVGALRTPIGQMYAKVDVYQRERKPWRFG